MTYDEMDKKRKWLIERAKELEDQAQELERRMNDMNKEEFLIIKKSDVIYSRYVIGETILQATKLFSILPEHPTHKELQSLYELCEVK